jgi:uncharacterized protein
MGCFVLRSALMVGFFWGVMTAGPAFAGDKGKEATARELMDLTGAGEMGIQVMDQMLSALQTNPNIPDGFIEKFQEMATPEDLVDLVVPIYTKHLDEKTMKAAIKFYKTTEGRKLIGAIPVITKESGVAGQEWGKKLGEAAMKAHLESVAAQAGEQEPASEEAPPEEAEEAEVPAPE